MSGIATSGGLSAAATLIAAGTYYLAVGTGTQNPEESVTDVVTEVERVLATVDISGNNVEITGYFTTVQAVGDLTEWGLYDDPSAGTLQYYGTIVPTITKAVGESLPFTVTVPVQNAS